MFNVPKVYAVSIAPYFSPAATFPTIGSIINVLIPNVLILAGIALFIMIIVTGFQFISKAGKLDATEFQKVSATLTAAIVGFIIVVIAYWLLKIIEITTGVKIINPGI